MVQPIDQRYFELSWFETAGGYLAAVTERTTEHVLRARVTRLDVEGWGNCSYPFVEKMRRVATYIATTFWDGPLMRRSGIARAGIGIWPLLFYGAATACYVAADYFYPKDYTYIRGDLTEMQENSLQPTILTLNACMWWGGLPIESGIKPARERIKPLCDWIRSAQADVVVLQEMSFNPALGVVEELKDAFAHFYTRIGPNLMGMESGLFVASKLPIVSAPQFHKFDTLLDARSNRGFFCVETPHYWVITTHLPDDAGEEGEAMRRRQLEQITQKIEELQANGKPCICLGDLNIHYTDGKTDEYSSSGIPENYTDQHQLFPIDLSLKNSTCTNWLRQYVTGVAQQELWENDDYVLVPKAAGDEQPIAFTSLVRPTFTWNGSAIEAPEKALSDHYGLLISCKLNPKT